MMPGSRFAQIAMIVVAVIVIIGLVLATVAAPVVN
jgi:putative copper export protein